jgi:hypothetical protein
MNEEYENNMPRTRRQSRELDFHNWDNFNREPDSNDAVNV